MRAVSDLPLDEWRPLPWGALFRKKWIYLVRRATAMRDRMAGLRAHSFFAVSVPGSTTEAIGKKAEAATIGRPPRAAPAICLVARSLRRNRRSMVRKA